MIFRSLITALLLLTCTAINAAELPDSLANIGIKNLKMPYPNLFTGGQPSEDNLTALKDAGVKRVINLRPASEFDGYDEAKATAEAGMEYLNIPISGASDLTLENVKTFAAALSDSDNSSFVHCASGNRVGALMALKANLLDGKSTAEAIEIGKASGLTSLEPAVQTVIMGSSLLPKF